MTTTGRVVGGVLAALLLVWAPVARAEGVRERDLARCFAEAHREFGTLQRLLAEARRQAQRSAPGSEERRAAEAAMERLAERGARAAARASRCVEQAAPGRADLAVPGFVRARGRDATGRAVVEVEAPQDERERAVAREGDTATALVVQDVRLAELLALARLEKVDGTGELPRAEALGMVSRAAGALSRCYEALLERRGLQPGEAVLSVVVEADGRLRHARLERATLGGTGFRRCLRRAASRLRPRLRPRGGWVGYQVTLRFGETDPDAP